MNTFEMIGLFVVLLCCTVGAATILITAGYGAMILKHQWQHGLKWDQTERQVQEVVER